MGHSVYDPVVAVKRLVGGPRHREGVGILLGGVMGLLPQ